MGSSMLAAFHQPEIANTAPSVTALHGFTKKEYPIEGGVNEGRFWLAATNRWSKSILEIQIC